jgi:hypothetical protein
MLVLVAFSGTVLAGENVYKATDNEELFGAWVNKDYSGRPPQKVIYKLGGTEIFPFGNEKEAQWTTEDIISHKWADSEGNIWYKSKYKANYGDSGFMLLKVSNSGKTLEFVFQAIEHPKKLDIKNDNYRIYNRK